MPFIKIEGNTLLNTDLVERVELQEAKKNAILWIGGAPVESGVAYNYFTGGGLSVLKFASGAEVRVAQLAVPGE